MNGMKPRAQRLMPRDADGQVAEVRIRVAILTRVAVLGLRVMAAVE